MNFDDVLKTWRSQDLSSLYGVDKTLLHRALQQEQVKLERQVRRVRWIMYVVNAGLFLTAVLFLAIMIDPKDDDVLNVWDYVVAVVGVAASMTLAGALFAYRRSRQARDQRFGDSLRDHLRRRIAQIDDEATIERRFGRIIVATTLVCAWAISIVLYRINDVPWGKFSWRPSFPFVLTFGLLYLGFLAAARGRRRSLARKPQLEALLKELEDQ
jgi:hypothetical protein